MSVTSAVVTPRSAAIARVSLVRQPAQILLEPAQVEEQLALRLGGGDLHQPPVAQHVLVDLGADPVHGERHQAHADVRVEALHGLHQADVAFLNQVADRQAVAAVAAGDVHDEAQVRQHQLTGGIEVAVVLQAARQRELLFARQHGNARHAFDVGIEAPDRTGQNEIGSSDRTKRSGHFEDVPPLEWVQEFSNRAIGVLTGRKVPARRPRSGRQPD